MKAFLILIISSFFLVGCHSSKLIEETDSASAVAPIELVLEYTRPSFDKNEQNSGIIDFVQGEGWLITDRALSRYNTLIKKFGNSFEPPISENYEVSVKFQPNKAIFLSQEGMVKFAIMNQKQ